VVLTAFRKNYIKNYGQKVRWISFFRFSWWKERGCLACFEDWKKSWHKCYISGGDYFKGNEVDIENI